MQEIKCPHCGEVFQVDESGYQQIAQQVRDREFANELSSRERRIQTEYEKDVRLLKNDLDKEKAVQLSAKDAAIGILEKKIIELEAQVKNSSLEKEYAEKTAIAQKEKELFEKDSQLNALQTELRSKENEYRLREKELRDKHTEALREKNEELNRYRDFKARQSTKMIGESLEQHCLSQFNALRMVAFPNAYFEKDNDARTGSKGDFIYREQAEDGTEILSIMFEMKNEGDTTASKHKNEDFFKELDKDRSEKKCEYAVLVSMLEFDSELYNNGIVDVSYRYPKMFVVRPQFFIPIISLLRGAAMNALKYKQELALMQRQQLDLSSFEDNMNTFKTNFARNYRLASEKFNTAIEEIDKTIDHLQKTKAALLSSENNLRLANDKVDDLSIKKLTRNAPSVKAMFDALQHP